MPIWCFFGYADLIFGYADLIFGYAGRCAEKLRFSAIA